MRHEWGTFANVSHACLVRVSCVPMGAEEEGGRDAGAEENEISIIVY